MKRQIDKMIEEIERFTIRKKFVGLDESIALKTFDV